jgi:tetratricopeptide (TPR) repeat protein
MAASHPAVLLLVKGIALRESRPEEAKDLLSAAARDLGGVLRDKAQVHLAITYSWTGEFSEGLALVEDVLSRKLIDEVRFQALLAKATLQISTPRNTLATLATAKKYFDVIDSFDVVDLRLRGAWHNQRGRALKELKDYDKASIEYAGAAIFFEQAGIRSGTAMAFNNQAGVYLKWGKLDEALEAVKKAIAIYTELRDPMLPHSQDQMAQILIAMGRTKEAKQVIDGVIQAVETSDKKELLLEALLTRAKVLVRLGSPVEAFIEIDRAEELGEYLARPDLRLTTAKTKKEVAATFATQAHIEMVQLALQQSNGAVRNAASRLGISHATLIPFIKNHSLDRLAARPKSVIPKPLKQ